MHVLLQYQSKSYYIIGQEVYYSIGRFYYIIGQLLQYRAFLLHYRAVITVSGVYYIIGWYSCISCSRRQSVPFWNGAGDKQPMELCYNRYYGSKFELMVSLCSAVCRHHSEFFRRQPPCYYGLCYTLIEVCCPCAWLVRFSSLNSLTYLWG